MVHTKKLMAYRHEKNGCAPRWKNPGYGPAPPPPPYNTQCYNHIIAASSLIQSEHHFISCFLGVWTIKVLAFRQHRPRLIHCFKQISNSHSCSACNRHNIGSWSCLYNHSPVSLTERHINLVFINLHLYMEFNIKGLTGRGQEQNKLQVP